MCIDIEKQTLFLLGGWDGTKELSDFWMYEIANGQWHCVSDDMTSDVGRSDVSNYFTRLRKMK